MLRTSTLISAVSGLQPTYEGLKPGRKSQVQKPVQRLQPTYEGLKHQFLPYFLLFFRKVCSLPMRD